MKHALKLKIHYLHIHMRQPQRVHAVAHVLKPQVNISLAAKTSILNIFIFLEPEICSVIQLPTDFITIDNCTSTQKIFQQQCLGGCISYSISGFHSPRSYCRCCSPEKTSTIQVEMQCTESNGDITIISKPYENILACSCSACKDKTDGK